MIIFFNLHERQISILIKKINIIEKKKLLTRVYDVAHIFWVTCAIILDKKKMVNYLSPKSSYGGTGYEACLQF